MKKTYTSILMLSAVLIAALLLGGCGNSGLNKLFGAGGDPPATTPTTPINQARTIMAGAYHSCALTSAGGVKCWGSNRYGQLGNGTKTASATPVDVSGYTSGVTAIAVGAVHACALTKEGGVKCWGENYWGQLGDGTNIDRSTPVNVSGLTSGVTAIAAGSANTCALTIAGGVKCWGWNEYGQLGDGSTTTRIAPVDVSGLTSGVTAIGAGYDHTCAITSVGGTKCWGWNDSGQLGDGTTTNHATPVSTSGLSSGITDIVAGEAHTCALTNAGGIKCWGNNEYGQLGDGTKTNHATPVETSGLSSGVAAVASGREFTCALTSAGVIKCWGWNGFGQLGDGSTIDSAVPANVYGLTSIITAISAGAVHTCALTSAGGVKCWGSNMSGDLGDGTTTDRITPVDVFGLTSGVINIYAGGFNTCAITTVGTVKCWGDSQYGQLGFNSYSFSTPQNVVGF